MRAFIVRPFGVKNGVDFDRVERELIMPALLKAGCTGGTTAEIVEAGNIRADMFEQLLKAELVVADISIHNANVFYELGIRHALRDARTYLIRSRQDEVPFDLRTDRYLTYEAATPAAAIEQLTEGIRRTRDSGKADSPVFNLIPGLEAQDWTKYLVVPEDFIEAATVAASKREVGDLEFYAAELAGLEWEIAGLRRLGRELFDLKAWEAARAVWERVSAIVDNDREAVLLMPTVLQKLGQLARSQLAVERALRRGDLDSQARAELWALRGSNEKTLWLQEWQAGPAAERASVALASPRLMRAAESYENGFAEDLNHYYSGLNALSMYVITRDLASAQPEIWAAGFDDDDEASEKLAQLRRRCARLEAAARYSIERALTQAKAQRKIDLWAEVSLADLRCITSRRPASVARAYNNALSDASDFGFESVTRQLDILATLGIAPDNVNAALTALEQMARRAQRSAPAAAKIPVARVLLFAATGDAALSAPEQESKLRDALRAAIESEKARYPGRLVGMAGAAAGGELLFHEVCAELGVESRAMLALPTAAYAAQFVQQAGPAWVERYQALLERSAPRVLADSTELPRWLRGRKNYPAWQRANLWLLCNACALGAGGKVTVFTLAQPDADAEPDPAAHLLTLCQQRGLVIKELKLTED
ncbi:MAG: hypothetical protein KF778_17180 [Rhodocyclaceae bacterium]|nr:hypothetical protein [Rhodocyclaceae bacterium]MBX3670136.1 hypothetical protein [Rhodocyclaceae bacterium]